jgi:hypothetical protein
MVAENVLYFTNGAGAYFLQVFNSANDWYLFDLEKIADCSR